MSQTSILLAVNMRGIPQLQVGEANSAVLEAAVSEVARRFDMKWNIFYDSAVKRVAIFVSKMDHCLWDLLIRHQAGDVQVPNGTAGGAHCCGRSEIGRLSHFCQWRLCVHAPHCSQKLLLMGSF